RRLPPLLCRPPCEAQESPKSRVIITRQPQRTERYHSCITCNRAERHLGKLSGNHGFTCEAQAQAQRNEVHQGLAPNIEPFYARVVTELGEAFDQVIMEGTTFLRLAE